MDEEEIRRLEELIPGTDQEDEPPQPQTPSLLYRLLHRPRREEPMPEDIAPQQLARTYGKGLKGLRLRSLAIFLLAAVAIFQLLVPALNYVWLPPLDDYQLQVWIACGLLGAGFLLSADVLFTGLARAFHGKVGMDTLCALSVIFTLADGLVLAMVQNREGQLPYTAAVLVGLFFLTHGTYHKNADSVWPAARPPRRRSPISLPWTRASGTAGTPTASGPVRLTALAARSRPTTEPSGSTAATAPSCCWPACCSPFCPRWRPTGLSTFCGACRPPLLPPLPLAAPWSTAAPSTR